MRKLARTFSRRPGLGVVLSALVLVHLVWGAVMGLSVDEAHYLLYAAHPDWSYFDHPPLVGWVHMKRLSPVIVRPQVLPPLEENCSIFEPSGLKRTTPLPMPPMPVVP